MVQLNQSCTLIQTILKRLEILLTACTTLQLQILLITQSKKKISGWISLVTLPLSCTLGSRGAAASTSCVPVPFNQTNVQVFGLRDEAAAPNFSIYLSLPQCLPKKNTNKAVVTSQWLWSPTAASPPGTSRHLIPLTCPGCLGRCIYHPLLAVIGTEWEILGAWRLLQGARGRGQQVMGAPGQVN